MHVHASGQDRELAGIISLLVNTWCCSKGKVSYLFGRPTEFSDAQGELPSEP